jgi:hypothetical protein
MVNLIISPVPSSRGALCDAYYCINTPPACLTPVTLNDTDKPMYSIGNPYRLADRLVNLPRHRNLSIYNPARHIPIRIEVYYLIVFYYNNAQNIEFGRAIILD